MTFHLLLRTCAKVRHGNFEFSVADNQNPFSNCLKFTKTNKTGWFRTTNPMVVMASVLPPNHRAYGMILYNNWSLLAIFVLKITFLNSLATHDMAQDKNLYIVYKNTILQKMTSIERASNWEKYSQKNGRPYLLFFR